MIGKKIEVDGVTYFQPGYINNGLASGTIFKDEDAFNNDREAVCYIPEASFDSRFATAVVINGEEWYSSEELSTYTRADLETMTNENGEDGEPYYTDDDGDRLNIEYFFNNLIWACPETYLNEYH